MIRTIRGADVGPQLFIGQQPDPMRFEPPRHEHPVHGRNICQKPWGGLWTSTLIEGPSSDWVRWCEAEDFGSIDVAAWWRIDPNASARLILIDTYADLDAIIAAYGRQPFPYMLDKYAPDFERIETDGYDGIHMTEQGQWETRLSHPLDLYGWDCECVLWLRWAFAGEPIEVKPATVKEESNVERVGA